MQHYTRAGNALLLFFAFIAFSLTPARAQQPAPARPTTGADTGQASGRLSWDDTYLYLAFQVDDPDLVGTNAAPFSKPVEDDSVAVYLQTGDARPGKPNEQSHMMAVSVAGGFTIVRGTADGKWITRPIGDIISRNTDRPYALKYAVTLQGTLNRADDRDQRYTVEMAIPWEVIGVKPADGLRLGYNVVARSRGGGFTSLSPKVKAAADIEAPAQWGQLTLASAAAALGRDTVVAPRVIDITRPPTIDGVLRAAEWADGHVFAFASPEKSDPRPVVVPPTTQNQATGDIAPLPTNRPLAVEKLMMARYVIRYQGDPRKLATFRNVRTADGRFLLSNQPANGAGPWFSADRPSWHRDNFAEMRRAGIDVALVEVGGPDADATRADEKALLVMVAALREMTTLLAPAPQVALWLDTEALVPAGTPKPDLSKTEGRDLLYRALRRWFQIVPPDVRARVHLPSAAGGQVAYPVVLSTADGFAALDRGFVEDMRKRFAADFGTDATLLVVGGEDFAASGANLAAFLPVGRGGKGSGAISSFAVQPGYDDTAISDRPALLPRRGGETYRQAWEAAIAADPQWIVLDSWNDFSRGTEVAPSRQFGNAYVDETRARSVQFNGLKPHDVKWLSHNAPSRMRPRQAVQVEVLLQNAGTGVLRGADGAALSYRWIKDGKVVGESLLRVPLNRSLFPTQTARLTVGVAAVRQGEEVIEGVKTPKIQPLPAGDYTLRIDFSQTDADKKTVWFGEDGDTPLDIPVKVVDDVPAGVVFEATNTPTLVQTGQTYPVWVRARWMGEEALAADAALLTWQLLSEDGTKTVETGSFPLGIAMPPGQTVTLRAPLRIADAGGNALPAAFPEGQTGTYRLRWLLTRTQATEAIPGVYSERIAVYPEDYKAFISLPDNVPVRLEADSITNVELRVMNSGGARWAPGEMTVGYHWFFPDGVEATWKPGIAVPIAQEMGAGKAIKISVPVRAPARDGEYVLAFDVSRGTELWLSTLPISRLGDLALVNVRVTGGRLRFVDLSTQYNVDAVAAAGVVGDGDLDGRGGAFPAESFPPDRYGLVSAASENGKRRWEDVPAYPSGYYADVSPSARRISFRYGPQEKGANNAVGCAGQTVNIPKGGYTGLHLAVAATGGQDRPLQLVLRYKDGTSETVTRNAAEWTRSPNGQEAIAVRSGRRRTAEGDEAGIVALRHVVLPVAVARELVSVTLPSDPQIKIFAMTLEQ